MPQKIFLNLPVADIERSRNFYAALGFTFDERFCDGNTACCVVSDTIFLMLLKHERFSGFSPKPVADTRTTAGALICLSFGTRAKVDQITDAAVLAGGEDNGNTQDIGFMYSRSFCDPDGHVFEPMWMDMDAARRTAEAAATV